VGLVWPKGRTWHLALLNLLSCGPRWFL